MRELETSVMNILKTTDPISVSQNKGAVNQIVKLEVLFQIQFLLIEISLKACFIFSKI